MEVIEQASSMRAIVSALRCGGKRVGFVPTMGALHEGHLQLLRASARENDVTICSVFVNPTQFNNSSDYNLYPRTLEQDISLLQTVGCDYLFAPNAEDIYPQQSLLQFSFGELEAVMEGAHRPGHFNGVATIVSKLFHIVQPHKAYFGQKDLQQVAIVRQLVQALSFNLELVCHPTVREADGLAMSSRNKRLTTPQRQLATQLYKALQLAKRDLQQKPVAVIKSEVAHFLHHTDELELEYFEIVDPITLQPLRDVAGYKEVALCVAAFVGEVRLIDNMLVNLIEA
ncbi:pantoate--beta-alanine ligase [Pontibacter sp. JH31]|uniref:Pantothenate synthetase n=1 Tax=Pontibacter aquaedesilientis TaxID=2766980 RepID=A0ABR7XGR4_9BACT|nr:pantoate--beta-alanine ligase [Pontibacter aquaedesilientis]MBD1397499.1 pantoate--beta-alanine ligase [Pontibacter aquaedesilientis]